MSRRCNQIKHFTLSVVRVLTLRPSQVTGEYLRDEFQVNPNYFANSQISSLCAGCDSDTLSGDLCFPKSWRVADFNKECHFNINILCPQKSRIARMKGLLVMQHIPCRLILTVVTQHQFQDETYHGPGPGALNCILNSVFIRQNKPVLFPHWTLNHKPVLKL